MLRVIDDFVVNNNDKLSTFRMNPFAFKSQDEKRAHGELDFEGELIT